MDPYLYRIIIDDYASRFYFDNYKISDYALDLSKILLAIVGVAMVSRIAKNLQDYFLNVLNQRVATQIFVDGMNHSMNLKFETYESLRSGETINILQKVKIDIERLTHVFVNVVVAAVVSLVFVFWVSIAIHPMILVIYGLSIPLIFFTSTYLSRKIKKIQTIITQKTAAFSGYMTESLRNIELIKSLGLQEQEIKVIENNTNQILALELEKVKKLRSISFIQGTTINFIRTVLAMGLLFLIFYRKLTLGQYFSLYMYSFYVFNVLQEIGTFITVYRETDASLDNFNNFMNLATEPISDNLVEPSIINALSLKQVSFRHPLSNSWSLQDIDIELNRGKSYAFVGSSGAGKSTLLKIILGLYQPQEGKFMVNDTPFEQIHRTAYKKHLSLVSQDIHLFSGTLLDNILFSNQKAQVEDVMTCLAQAEGQFILDKSDLGLHMNIGENGVRLSGGEKQRVAIARALLRNPSVLIFDEATSALDSITEAHITKTIQEISRLQDKIILIVAHRLSTIKHCDEIFVLDKGRIVASGSHDDLLHKNEKYRAMWIQQSS